MNCGQPLGKGAQAPKQAPLARSSSELLGVLTVRLLISLLGLWLIKTIINWLPFAHELPVSETGFSILMLINAVIYLIVILLLLGYAGTVRVLWPQAYPRFREVGFVIMAVVYIGVLIAVYNGFLPLIVVFSDDPSILIIFQALLLLFSAIILGYAFLGVYRKLPAWLMIIRQDQLFSFKDNMVVCLNCGHLNDMNAEFCSTCGQQLTNANRLDKENE
jgi:hypothetical protein